MELCWNRNNTAPAGGISFRGISISFQQCEHIGSGHLGEKMTASLTFWFLKSNGSAYAHFTGLCGRLLASMHLQRRRMITPDFLPVRLLWHSVGPLIQPVVTGTWDKDIQATQKLKSCKLESPMHKKKLTWSLFYQLITWYHYASSSTVQARVRSKISSFSIVVLIRYDLRNGRNRSGHYDKNSSTLKKNKIKSSFIYNCGPNIFINVYRSRNFYVS